MTGSMITGAHPVYETFIELDFVSSDYEVLSDGAGSDDDDAVTFTMVFDVTAQGGTVYVGDTSAGTKVSVGTGAATDAIVYSIYDSGTATLEDLADQITFTTPAGVTDSTDNIKLTDGATSEVTLIVTRTNSGDATDDGIFYMELVGVAWATTDTTEYNSMYKYNLEDFQTGSVYIN